MRTYPQFSTTAADRASGDFQTRGVVDRAKLLGYEYVEEYPWLRDAEKAGHEVVEKLKSKPVASGRYDIVVDPSQLFLAIHESVGHSTELDRALGWEANMAGTSFVKPTDAGKLRFGSKIVNLVGDRTQPGGLATTGYDDEGVKSERWHIVRDGTFVDWQTTRELAPLVGQQKSHGCLHSDSWSSVPFPRMPNVSLEPAATEVSLDQLFSEIKRGLFIEGRGVSSIDQQRYNFQFGGAVIREIRDGKLGAMVKDAAYQSRTPDFWASCDGIGGPATYQLWGTSADGKGEPGQTNAVSHGCPPARFRNITVLNTAALLMLTRDAALKICETVLAHAKSAGAEDAMVSLQNSIESHARFADNSITTSGRSEDLDITVTVWVGGRRGAITGNDAGADALKRISEEAVQIARVSPVHREYLPTLGPLEYPAARGFAAATADVDLAARAAALQAALGACRTAKVNGAGFHTAQGVGYGGRDGERQPPVFPDQPGGHERHRAQRRRHGLGLLRRRSLRPRPPRREADCRTGGRQGGPLARTEGHRAGRVSGDPRAAGGLGSDRFPQQRARRAHRR